MRVGETDAAFGRVDLEGQVAQVDAVQHIPWRRELEVVRRVCKMHHLAHDIAEREIAEPSLEDRAGLVESRRETQRHTADTEIAEHRELQTLGDILALRRFGAALGRFLHRLCPARSLPWIWCR